VVLGVDGISDFNALRRGQMPPWRAEKGLPALYSTADLSRAFRSSVQGRCCRKRS
jgi:hypothetical protein